MVDPRRELHLIVACDDRLLVTGEPARLPTMTVEPGTGTTVSAALTALADRWALDAPLLEVFFDYAADPKAGPVATLVTVEVPPPGWAPPDGLRWTPFDGNDAAVDAIVARLADGIRPRAAQQLRELAGREAIPALRPPWSRPGWYARITAWATARLEELGRPPTGPLVQVRHWGISALGRMATADGAVWCKTAFPLFRLEPAITRLLHELVPGAVTPVLAVDEEAGFLLMDDLGPASLADRPDLDPVAIATLVDIQRTLSHRLPALEALGCPDRRLERLPALLDEALADAEIAGVTGVRPARRAQLVDWVAATVPAIASLGLPDTLLHGDFHPDNVALVGERVVVFDWSDAPIGNPALDILTWLEWQEGGDHERGERAWAAWREGWHDVCPADRLDAALPSLHGVAAAYHTISYADIVRALEPERRVEHHDGLRFFAGKLDAAVPNGVGMPSDAAASTASLLHDDA